MPRPLSSRPWLHARSGYWCATHNGRRVYLDRDERKAVAMLNRLRAGKAADDPAARDWLAAPLSDLADEFLEDVKARRSAGSLADYRCSLERAFAHLPAGLAVGDVRKLHLARVEGCMAKAGCSSTTVFKTLHALQRVFKWAVENDLLGQSPLEGYRKPRPRQRCRVATPAEFRAALRVSGPAFRRFLLALRLTGARPKELRTLRWEHVHLEAGLLVIPEHKTATTQEEPRPRVIPLVGAALSLVRWLARRSHGPADHVFLNHGGRPWSASALSSQRRYMQRRAGFPSKGGERIVLYTFRHSYATDAAGKVSDLELAELLGHTQTRTTRRYVHLNSQRVTDIARRAAGSSGAGGPPPKPAGGAAAS